MAFVIPAKHKASWWIPGLLPLVVWQSGGIGLEKEGGEGGVDSFLLVR